jgi:AraC-like DNA-binding protein
MEQQQAQQIEQQLRRNWEQIRHRILDQFMETSRADLDAARDVNDLVQRIADRSHHSERYVETRLQDMVGTAPGGGGMGSSQGGQPFGSGQ